MSEGKSRRVCKRMTPTDEAAVKLGRDCADLIQSTVVACVVDDIRRGGKIAQAIKDRLRTPEGEEA